MQNIALKMWRVPVLMAIDASHRLQLYTLWAKCTLDPRMLW